MYSRLGSSFGFRIYGICGVWEERLGGFGGGTAGGSKFTGFGVRVLGLQASTCEASARVPNPTTLNSKPNLFVGSL